jgi:hypothetical protein
MLGWAQCGSHKKCARAHYAKLVFLHPGGSAVHIVSSVASGRVTAMHYFLCLGRPGVHPTKTMTGHIMLKLCFCIDCNVLVTWCILVQPEHKMSTHYFHDRVGPARIPQKARGDTSHRTCVLASDVIDGSHSAF